MYKNERGKLQYEVCGVGTIKVVLVIAYLLFSEDRKSGCLSIAWGPNSFGHGPGGTRLILLDIYIQRECETQNSWLVALMCMSYDMSSQGRPPSFLATIVTTIY
jgi:hypothetical protein